MIIIKIGGGKTINLPAIISDLATLEESFVIVHGANALRDEIASKLGTPKKIITSASGYESVFSDKDAIDAILMAYAGLQNKRIVELCQQNAINAVGLTGVDGKTVQGARNKGIRVRENGKNLIKRDFSGKPKQVNGRLLKLLLENDFTPVLTIPIIDEQNIAINSENDDIVTLLQQALSAETVVQLIEADGFLRNADDTGSKIDRLSKAELVEWEASVDGRIKRKLHALTKMVSGNVKNIILADGRIENPVTNALNGGGTWIK